MHIFAKSQIPVGAGLGSSASFSVCLAASLLYLFDIFPQKPVADADEKLKFTQDNFELINKWAFIAEKVIHINPSGLDNTVSCFGSLLLNAYKRGNNSI